MDFRLLGPFEVGDLGAPVNVGAGKQRALLALLLIYAGQAVPLDRIRDELWGGDPPPSARNALWVYVANLRRALEPGRARGAPGRLLVTGPASYALRVDKEAIDTARFERLSRAGREAVRHDPKAAAGLLRDALRLWRGPVLAEFNVFKFAQVERVRLEELEAVTSEARIEAELMLGRHAEIVGELRALASRHPLRERLHELLMLALYRSDRQAEALAAYDHARDVLATELGLDPGTALQRLHQAILRQDLDLYSPRGTCPDEPQADVPARLLPHGTAVRLGGPFVGRVPEVAALSQALADARAGHGRFVLVAGEPGIGKTHLAQHLADKARASHLPVWWGRTWAEDGAPAFWPLIQIGRSVARDLDPARLRRAIGRDAPIVRQIMPEALPGDANPAAPAVADSAEARFILFDAVSRMLIAAAADTGALVIVDDLHHADEPSLVLLRFLAREIGNARLLVLCTYRDSSSDDSPLSRLLADAAREPATQWLHLTGMGRAETARLIEAVTGAPPGECLITAIHDRTKGNPFFIVELVRLLHREGRLDAQTAAAARTIPSAISAVVRGWVDSLPEPSRRVLAAASAIGPDFDVENVAAAVPLPVEAILHSLARAAAEGLTTPAAAGGRRHSFASPLVRDALCQQLAGGERTAGTHTPGALTRIPRSLKPRHLSL